VRRREFSWLQFSTYFSEQHYILDIQSSSTVFYITKLTENDYVFACVSAELSLELLRGALFSLSSSGIYNL